MPPSQGRWKAVAPITGERSLSGNCGTEPFSGESLWGNASGVSYPGRHFGLEASGALPGAGLVEAGRTGMVH